MGNCLQGTTGLRWQLDMQETPWNLRLQNAKRRTRRYFRCWSCHINEGCPCLPWKTTSTLKARQEPPKQDEGMTSSPIQDNANETYTEELCYILVHHKAVGSRPPGHPADGLYENISSKAERPRASTRGTETEYSVIHFPSPPQPLPPAEDEYELLVPSRFSSHVPPHPRPPVAPFETHFPHRQ